MKLLILVAIFALLELALPALGVFGMLDQTLYMLASLGVGMALVITLVVITIFTADWVEPALGAKFSGKPLWALLTATRKLKFVVGETKEKIFSTKDYGDYFIDPEASYMWPNGITGSIASTFYGVGLRPDMVRAASMMKKAGIKDGDDMKAMLMQAGADDKEIEVLSETSRFNGEPLRLGEVVNYFQHNLTPSYIQSVIKLSVARALEGKKELPMALIMGISIMLICAGIAYLIISGAQQSSTAGSSLASCQSTLTSCLTRVITPATGAGTTTTTLAGNLPLPITIT